MGRWVKLYDANSNAIDRAVESLVRIRTCMLRYLGLRCIRRESGDRGRIGVLRRGDRDSSGGHPGLCGGASADTSGQWQEESAHAAHLVTQRRQRGHGSLQQRPPDGFCPERSRGLEPASMRGAIASWPGRQSGSMRSFRSAAEHGSDRGHGHARHRV